MNSLAMAAATAVYPLSLTTSRHNCFPPTTLTFSKRPSSSLQFSFQSQYDASADVQEEDSVIGDCLVFEEGIFDDPFLQKSPDFRNGETQISTSKISKSRCKIDKTEINQENLIPEKWLEIQREISITKKERRKLAQQLEYGKKVEKRRQGLRPISIEDFNKVKDDKLNIPTTLISLCPSISSILTFSILFCHSTEVGTNKLFTKEEKLLLNRRIPDLAVATSGKWHPVHTLAASGEFYLMTSLLKHDVDINALDKDGLTGIHKAILGKKQAIFNCLLRESANPFIRDKEGATLMHYAVRTASSQMIKILLLYNVDINLQDNDGWTALHLAVQSHRTDIVRLLLIKGADKTIKNQDGLTPLDLCLYAGRDKRTYELIKLIKRVPKRPIIS
ncbi:ankyrin repeat domain-containing protein, chloroplastic [Olea europaea var. sylvestris]|uniref:ankyrin repeat domain-containing protein, chloroplastic n=1 Tax=Olea europaea var. sylvestris TaxID=158386 RepID=UPI000C1D7DE3|nr:ankyrin repeat domain-containing protein, chloroplastic [Olea europaea var. sylvestris]